MQITKECIFVELGVPTKFMIKMSLLRDGIKLLAGYNAVVQGVSFV